MYDNVAIAHEHSGEGRVSRQEAVLGAIGFVGLEMDPRVKVGTLGARDRRLVEVARAVVGKPRMVLLDEPAAGLPDEETGHMGRVIRKIPEHMGALVILVDQFPKDMARLGRFLWRLVGSPGARPAGTAGSE